jgi:hypothetical protein
MVLRWEEVGNRERVKWEVVTMGEGWVAGVGAGGRESGTAASGEGGMVDVVGRVERLRRWVMGGWSEECWVVGVRQSESVGGEWGGSVVCRSFEGGGGVGGSGCCGGNVGVRHSRSVTVGESVRMERSVSWSSVERERWDEE